MACDARLGRCGVRPRSGDRRIGLAAGSWRHVRAGLRPHRDCARRSDAARSAYVLGRRATAPSRPLTPHADCARPAARAPDRGAAGGNPLTGRRRSAREPGLGVRAAADRVKPQLELDVDRPARITRHDWRRAPVDLPAYLASGLPAKTMGRVLTQDPLFFGAALAGGTALAELAVSAEARRAPRRSSGPLALRAGLHRQGARSSSKFHGGRFSNCSSRSRAVRIEQLTSTFSPIWSSSADFRATRCMPTSQTSRSSACSWPRVESRRWMLSTAIWRRSSPSLQAAVRAMARTVAQTGRMGGSRARARSCESRRAACARGGRDAAAQGRPACARSTVTCVAKA